MSNALRLPLRAAHLTTRPYPWHEILDGGSDPAAGFKVENMPRVSAATLAYGTLNEEQNRIDLVDRTSVAANKTRVCSPFTVESLTPYSYVPVSASTEALDTATIQSNEVLVHQLLSTPICDTSGRPILEVIETEQWLDGGLVQYGARCVRPGREGEFSGAVMLTAAEVQITADSIRRAGARRETQFPRL